MNRAVARAQGRCRPQHRFHPRPPNLTGVVTGVALTALMMSPAHANKKQPAEDKTPMRAASKQIAAAPHPLVNPSHVRVPIPHIDPKDRLAKKPRKHWDRLADCESGSWDANAKPVQGSARWDYGARHGERDNFEGGLNFHPDTWEAYRSPSMPAHAGQASKGAQILVAERVLAAQGWRAWPRCSRKLGLR
ncbi:MAG: transglycosylase family protein [Actinomycetota bacterium]|nr:transglycosylase family protein [Actinomycetota bacterium]